MTLAPLKARALQRRCVISALGAVAMAAARFGSARSQAGTSSLTVRPRLRVIIDNDFGGDPDGLFELAHHALSPSVEIRAVIGSHLHEGDPFDPTDQQSDHAAAKAKAVLKLTGKSGSVPVYAGKSKALTRADTSPRLGRAPPPPSPATAAIITEALRSDPRPLFYLAGAGLTDLASAWLIEPRLAERLTLVWIGGPEHRPQSRPGAAGEAPEYNLTIDLVAAQILFARSSIPIWQVPRDTYRRMLISFSELRALAATGPLGAYLFDQIIRVADITRAYGMNIGETYILGDSPLVTLTALQSSFQPDPSSSDYEVMPTPGISDDGRYVAVADGRPMRVYTTIDTRLTFADLIAKLQQGPH